MVSYQFKDFLFAEFDWSSCTFFNRSNNKHVLNKYTTTAANGLKQNKLILQ